MKKHLNAETCRQVIAACLPQIPILSAEAILDGWCSLVLQINDEYIFRFARWPEVEAQFEKEIRLLPALSPALPVAVPCIEFTWKDCPGCAMPFVGYRKIHGVPLTPALATPGLAMQLGEFLSALHSFPAEEAVRLGVSDATPPHWRQQYVDLYDKMRTQVFPWLKPSAQAMWTTAWETFLTDDANFRFRPALIHRDLGAEHILCDPRRGEIAGVIDWGDAAIGDPALDFVGLWAGCGRDFAERVAADYAGDLDETFWRRVFFYANIIPFYTVEFALMTGDDGLLREGLDALNRV